MDGETTTEVHRICLDNECGHSRNSCDKIVADLTRRLAEAQQLTARMDAQLEAAERRHSEALVAVRARAETAKAERDRLRAEFAKERADFIKADAGASRGEAAERRADAAEALLREVWEHEQHGGIGGELRERIRAHLNQAPQSETSEPSPKG